MHADTIPRAPTRTRVFVNGEDGYTCYRIPAIVGSDDGGVDLVTVPLDWVTDG